MKSDGGMTEGHMPYREALGYVLEPVTQFSCSGPWANKNVLKHVEKIEHTRSAGQTTSALAISCAKGGTSLPYRDDLSSIGVVG